MSAHARPEWRVPTPLGRLLNVELPIAKLEVCGNKHWPPWSEMQLRCCVSQARGMTKKVFVKCHKCDMGLRVKQTSFEDYHTKAQL